MSSRQSLFYIAALLTRHVSGDVGTTAHTPVDVLKTTSTGDGGAKLTCETAPGYLSGVCTSGAENKCVEGTVNAGIQCRSLATSGVQIGQANVGPAGTKAVPSNNFAQNLVCPKEMFGFAQCSSGGTPECDGAFVGLWCHVIDKYRPSTTNIETVCANNGGEAVCPFGYAVVASCGSGTTAACAIGDCADRPDTWSMITCAEVRVINAVATVAATEPTMVPTTEVTTVPTGTTANPAAPAPGGN